MPTRGLHNRRGSIPARAGEPLSIDERRGSMRVYPRTGGGTNRPLTDGSDYVGLSPHGRGNPAAWTTADLTFGSIPARAGEPLGRGIISTWSKVYPRTGGGTTTTVSLMATGPGLSPHGRGNQNRDEVPGSALGSIPARAGEPPALAHSSRPNQVYPRTGGGTVPMGMSNREAEGLSPHGRGNRRPMVARANLEGSIPARAGEPQASRLVWRQNEVYPRTGGGTDKAGSGVVTSWGLSPHGRGNHGTSSCGSGSRRSIPARAGEPMVSRNPPAG